MARDIPEFVRAAAGLAATLLDEARKLPETLPGLSVRIVGLAMQTAMKVQQGYSGLVARGDELFTGIRGDDEPGLATFDDEVEAQAGGYRESKFDRADVTFADNEVLDELAIDENIDTAPAKAAPAKRAARKQAGKRTAAPAKKQTAKKAPPAKKTTRARAAASDVVTGGEAAVDEALGSAPATPETTAQVEPTPSADAVAATDEGGGTVAAATGVRTDEGDSDTSADDAAIAEGAAVDAVGGESVAPTDDAQGGSELSGSQAAGTAPVDGYDGWSIAQLRGRLRGYAESTVRDLVDYEQATRAREPYLRMLRNRLERVQTAST
jgi:hypothetical protein